MCFLSINGKRNDVFWHVIELDLHLQGIDLKVKFIPTFYRYSCSYTLCGPSKHLYSLRYNWSFHFTFKFVSHEFRTLSISIIQKNIPSFCWVYSLPCHTAHTFLFYKTYFETLILINMTQSTRINPLKSMNALGHAY